MEVGGRRSSDDRFERLKVEHSRGGQRVRRSKIFFWREVR